MWRSGVECVTCVSASAGGGAGVECVTCVI